AYKEDKDAAEDTLHPGAMTEIERRVKDGADATNLDIMRHTLLNNEYQRALRQYDAERLAEELEVELNPIPQEHIDRILEGNPNWNAEQIMHFLDVLG
ncbi:MAG: hypothetical protein K2K92_08120, partial [Duncaniella sp.]|nr:hypothetical protein [Duncaniella sp.]